jgi:hypothetical protein
MKKLQLLFMALAFIVGLSSVFAFAPKHNSSCATITTLYYKSGTSYLIADANGTCQGISGNCLYYNAGTPQSPDYLPCTDDYTVGPWSQ